MIVSLLLLFIASGIGMLAHWQRSIALEQRDLAGRKASIIDRTVRLVSINSAGWLKEICLEAATVTRTLAVTRDGNEFSTNAERFWISHFGPMLVIEMLDQLESESNNSWVESGVVRFGAELKRWDSATPLPSN